MADVASITRVFTLKDEIAKGGFGPVPNDTIPGYEIKPLAPRGVAGHRIQLCNLAVGFDHYAHAHPDAHSVMIFLEGEGEFVMGGGKTIHVKPGDVAVSVQGQLHGARNTGSTTLRYFTIEGPIPRDGTSRGQLPPEQALPDDIPGVERVQSLQALIDDWDKGLISGEGIPGYGFKRVAPAKHFHHRINIVSVEPNSGKFTHAHEDADTIFLVLEGEGEYLPDNEHGIPIKPGDVAIAVAGQLHGSRNTGSGPLRYLCIEGPLTEAEMKSSVEREEKVGL
jgi:mannose-6-phosphate isomerase-like protein (cupin superfamily)